MSPRGLALQPSALNLAVLSAIKHVSAMPALRRVELVAQLTILPFFFSQRSSGMIFNVTRLFGQQLSAATLLIDRIAPGRTRVPIKPHTLCVFSSKRSRPTQRPDIAARWLLGRQHQIVRDVRHGDPGQAMVFAVGRGAIDLADLAIDFLGQLQDPT